MKGYYILYLLLSLASAAKSQQKQETESALNGGENRPNIILIVGESHRADALRVAGHPFVQTPNLDALSQSGVRFTKAYVTTAICSVSRASILSGQHRARHGINDFKTGFTEEAFDNTLPLVLKKEGYSLAWIGSYGVGTPPSTEEFDLWEPKIPWVENGIHSTDNIVEKASTWLEDRNHDAPFYLQLNFASAHEIDPTPQRAAYYQVQDRFKNLYSEVTIPVPASADPKVWNSFPDFFRTDDNIARKRWHGFFSTPELSQKNSKDYYRLLTGVDDAVGQLRAKLNELNLAENTIIVYSSDHGYSLGEQGIMGKWYPFETGIKVPLILYNPKDSIARGKEVSSTIALNIDIAPTILGMAGVNVPTVMQGQNLMHVMNGKQQPREHFFYEHTVFKTPEMPAVEAVVSTDYKYINFIEHGFEILYDSKNDPNELTNLVGHPDYKEALDRMRALYKQERDLAK